MLYVFGDESYPHGSAGRSTTFMAVAVPQAPFRSKKADLLAAFQRRGKRRQVAILEILRALGSSIVLGRADIPDDVGSLDAMDSFPDVGTVSRRDFIWSQLFAFTSAKALYGVAQSGTVYSCVDFFYDPKDLRTPHKEALAMLMKVLVDSHMAYFYAARHGPQPSHPKLRRIQAVSKPSAEHSPDPGSLPNHIPLGISCAHELQVFTLKSPSAATAMGVVVDDCSEDAVKLLRDGKRLLLPRGSRPTTSSSPPSYLASIRRL
jgi:hypothetical protein